MDVRFWEKVSNALNKDRALRTPVVRVWEMVGIQQRQWRIKAGRKWRQVDSESKLSKASSKEER